MIGKVQTLSLIRFQSSGISSARVGKTNQITFAWLFFFFFQVILSLSLNSLAFLGGENPTQCGGKRVPKSSSGLLISAWITDIQIMCLMFKQVPLSGEKVAKQSFVM